MSMNNQSVKQNSESDKGPRRARLRNSVKTRGPQLLLLSTKKGQTSVASVVFGKYTVAGITKKEALVNGKCLRIPVTRIGEKKLEELLKKQKTLEESLNLEENLIGKVSTITPDIEKSGKFKLKKLRKSDQVFRATRRLEKNDKIKTPKPSQKTNKPLSLKSSEKKSPVDPTRISAHGRVRTPNPRFTNFVIPEFLSKTPKSSSNNQKDKFRIKANILSGSRCNMSTDLEASEKSDPLHIPDKPTDADDLLVAKDDQNDSPDEVKSFLPNITTESDPLATTNEKPTIQEKDPLTLDTDPLTLDKDPLTVDKDPLTVDKDPLKIEKDPLSIDTDISEPVVETPSKPAQKSELQNKFNGQNVPTLRTYSNKRLRKSPVPLEAEDKRPRLDDTDTDDLEALLSGDIKPIDFPSPDGRGKTNVQNSNQSGVLNGSDSVKVSSAVQNETKSSTEKSASKVNGRINDVCYTYNLVCRSGKPGRKKILKNNLGFEKLVHQLKMIKLPAPNWKIRIFVTRDQQISEITFTNKEANERCVKFSRNSISYSITFGSRVVSLLGAPVVIDTHGDISLLLDIVNSLDENDPVIEYVSSTK